MKKRSGRRFVCLLIMAAFLCNTAFGVYARDSKGFIEEYAAWLEMRSAHVQVQLDKEYDEVQVVVTNEHDSDQIRFDKEERIAFEIEGLTEDALLQIRAYESRKLVHTALFRTVDTAGGDEDDDDEQIKVEKDKWQSEPSDEPISLELVFEEEVEKSSALEKREEAFYKRAFGTKDPERAQEEKEEWEEDKELSAKDVLDTFELEPNDTKDKADWLTIGKDAYGRIKKSGDVDYWKVKAFKNGEYRIWLGEMPPNKNYELYLYDGNGKEMRRSTNSGSMDELIEGVSMDKDKWYYVKIAGADDDANENAYYHITIDYLAPGAIVMPDLYEKNNTLADATEAKSDTPYQGTIHELGDVDYYKYRVELASTLEFNLSNIPSGMDLDIFLLDSNFKPLAKSDKSRNADELIIYNADPGYYYLKVAAAKRSALVYHEYLMEGIIRTIPVILVPGIGGSRLLVKENGSVSDAWANLDGMLSDHVIAVHRRILPLYPKKWGGTEVVQKEKGVEIFPEEDDYGLRAIEYLSYTNFDYAHDKSEQYYSMSQHLQKMGYRKGFTLFGVPYDWRLSSTVNAKRLKNQIDKAIRESKARQVQIVVHSMGGILTRETLLANASYQPKVKRVIYMGTPFLGSPRAYQALKYGYNFGIFFFNPLTLKAVAEFSPAVYELLPSRTFVQNNGFLEKQKGTKVEKLPFTAVFTDRIAQVPYVPLAKQADQNHNRWDKKKLNVQQYSIIGQGESTLKGYTFWEDRLQVIPVFDEAKGDGTVPFESASYDAKDIKKKYYVISGHADLPKNPYVIQQVAHLLLGIEKAQPQLSEQPKKNFKYNYYVIHREDGEFPKVALSSKNKTVELDESVHEFEGTRVEYHGNVIVVFMPQKEQDGNMRVQLQASPSLSAASEGGIIIDHYSSQGKRSGKETYNRFNLQGKQTLE